MKILELDFEFAFTPQLLKDVELEQLFRVEAG
jgi:hypothetical protein